MSVLLPNTWLALKRQQPLVEDDHGDAIPGGWLDPTPTYEGRASGGGANLQGGEDIEHLALDVALWPVLPKDIVVETDAAGVPTGRQWTVRIADLLRNSEDPTVDYVRVQGQRRVGTSTTP